MIFFVLQKEKNLLNRVKNLFSSNGSIWVSKNPYFYIDFKVGQITVESTVYSSCQALEPKNLILNCILALTFDRS
jgi:hypothetical protein